MLNAVLVLLLAAAVCAVATALPGPTDASGRPLIQKLGTVDLDMVECNPIVFKGRLYRFEWVRPNYWGNPSQRSHFRLVDHETGKATAPFGFDHQFGCAFVDQGRVYVTGTVNEGGRQAGRVQMFASKDLEHWESWTALDLDGFGIFNTSICRARDHYVMMFEIDRPADQCGVPFTARFATSKDLRHWELTPPECCYAKDRYTAPHCLRYLDGWYYDFYLEALPGAYEQYVVRSKDLVHWERSPLNPVLRASDDDRLIANARLTDAQRRRVATAVNINNSDIDFCEWRGSVVITYSWGNQTGVEHLAEAVYKGSLRRFLQGWFPKAGR